MKPAAVVSAFLYERQHFCRVHIGRSGAARDEMGPSALPAEIGLDGTSPQINGVAGVVGLEHVVEAIAIEIHEAQAVVASVRVEHRAIGRKLIVSGFPLAGLGVPGENVLIRQQIAHAVSIEIAEAPRLSREHREDPSSERRLYSMGRFSMSMRRTS